MKACIFDLDGTLCDTLTSISYCVNRVLKEFSYSEIPDQDIESFVGEGVDVLFQKVSTYLGNEELVDLADVKAKYKEYFKEDCMYQVKPYEGIREVLEYAKEKQLKIAVFSNKPDANTKKIIEECFVDLSFDTVRGQMDTVKRKPDVEGTLLVAKEMGVELEECLYIGDTAIDMMTGSNARMKTIGVLWGFRDRQELEKYNATYIVEKPEEIIGIIEENL